MKKTFIYAAAAALLLATAGCEHIDFEFDWQMLAESVLKQCSNNSE